MYWCFDFQTSVQNMRGMAGQAARCRPQHCYRNLKTALSIKPHSRSTLQLQQGNAVAGAGIPAATAALPDPHA